MTEPLLYDLREAAEKLSVAKRTVAVLLARGEIPSVRIGRRRLIPAEALADYVKRLEEAR